jgi:hypothetical protein
MGSNSPLCDGVGRDGMWEGMGLGVRVVAAAGECGCKAIRARAKAPWLHQPRRYSPQRLHYAENKPVFEYVCMSGT